jgi:hypothetical protein
MIYSWFFIFTSFSIFYWWINSVFNIFTSIIDIFISLGRWQCWHIICFIFSFRRIWVNKFFIKSKREISNKNEIKKKKHSLLRIVEWIKSRNWKKQKEKRTNKFFSFFNFFFIASFHFFYCSFFILQIDTFYYLSFIFFSIILFLRFFDINLNKRFFHF